MIELIARFSGGTLARSPEYVPLILLGLLAIQDDLGRTNPAMPPTWSANPLLPR